MRKLLFIILILILSETAHGMSIPLTVTEPSNQARANEPVTTGVPLKQSDNITLINSLQLLNESGTIVPAQFTVLSRWGGVPTDTSKPIKWVLLDFVCPTIPANGTATYSLNSVGSGGGNATGTNLVVTTSDPTKFTVATGKAKYEISTSYFNLFDKVWLYNNGTADYTDQVIDQAGTGGMTINGQYLETNLVTNGTFTSNLNGWTSTGWTWGNPGATHTVGSISPLSQSISVTTGNIYIVTSTIYNAAGTGTVTLSLGGTNGSAHVGGYYGVTYTDKVTATTSDGINYTPSSDFTGRISLVKVQRQDFSTFDSVTSGTPESISLEESGPLRSVILVRGTFKNSSAGFFAPPASTSIFSQPYTNSYVYYNARIHFYNNQDYVKVFITLENNGASGVDGPENGFAPKQGINLKSFMLPIPTLLGNSLTVNSVGDAQSLTTSDIYRVYQGLSDASFPAAFTAFYYTGYKNASQTSSGHNHAGWLDINNGSFGLSIAQRHFWQNYPKAYNVTNGSLTAELFPVGGYFPIESPASPGPMSPPNEPTSADAKTNATFYFHGGKHKTHEMVIRAYAGTADSTTVEKLSGSMDYPLMALADPSWYVSTATFGPIAISGLTSPDSTLNEAISKFDRHQRSMVNAADSTNGLTIANIRTQNVSSINLEFAYKERFFGWANFGDLLGWASTAGNPPSLHYDWPYAMFLHYMRTGLRSFFDLGVEMAKHRYDVDQYHGARSALGGSAGNEKYTNYSQVYESECHMDYDCNSNSTSGLPSHTWSEGEMLYYWLTGDRKALETVEEVALMAVNHFGTGGVWDATSPTNIAGGDNLRQWGWPALNLINAYRIDGNPAYLTLAYDIVAHSLLNREQMVSAVDGIGGHFGVQYSPGNYSGSCLQTRQTETQQPCIYANFPGYSGLQASSICTNAEWDTIFAYIIDPIIQVHYETQDTSIKNLLIRMAGFMKDYFLMGGVSGGGEYYPYNTIYCSLLGFDLPGQVPVEVGGETVKNGYFADLLAYAYYLSGDSAYLNKAKLVFKDLAFYYLLGASAPIPESARSDFTFVDSSFPDSHTKIHQYFNRTGQVFLNVLNGDQGGNQGTTYNDSISLGVKGFHSEHLRGAGIGVSAQ